MFNVERSNIYPYYVIKETKSRPTRRAIACFESFFDAERKGNKICMERQDTFEMSSDDFDEYLCHRSDADI